MEKTSDSVEEAVMKVYLKNTGKRDGNGKMIRGSALKFVDVAKMLAKQPKCSHLYSGSSESTVQYRRSVDGEGNSVNKWNATRKNAVDDAKGVVILVSDERRDGATDWLGNGRRAIGIKRKKKWKS